MTFSEKLLWIMLYLQPLILITTVLTYVLGEQWLGITGVALLAASAASSVIYLTLNWRI